MFKLMLIVVVVAVVVPVLAGVPLPSSLSPQALGQFAHSVIAYWFAVYQAIAERFTGSKY